MHIAKLLKNIINFFLVFFLNIKIVKFFSHRNFIIVLKLLSKKRYLKISFSTYFKKLLLNEYYGYKFYFKIKEITLKKNEFFFKKNLFFSYICIKSFVGTKTSYMKSFKKNYNQIIKIVNYYDKFWPKNKNVSAHGDLTFDNILFYKNEITIIDWENFKKREVWGFDIIYFLLTCLIIPNLNKKKLNNIEKQYFLLAWKKIKKKITNKQLKSNPIIFFEKTFHKNQHWRNLFIKNPNKFFINKINRDLRNEIDAIFR